MSITLLPWYVTPMFSYVTNILVCDLYGTICFTIYQYVIGVY